jgi:NAD(P)H-dependent FMN reductase
MLEQESLRIAVIAGSTRPERHADAVARWVIEQATAWSATATDQPTPRFELVDLADHPLPFLDEPLPAVFGQYERVHTQEWAATIGAFDGYVFVVPEYNRSIPGVLKNAIDFLHGEWNDKVAGFVGYGADAAGARAVEHLRLVMGELQVADVRAHVLLSGFDDFADDGRPTPRAHAVEQLETMVGQLVSWGTALRGVRSAVALR